MIRMTKETVLLPIDHIGIGAAWKTSGGGQKGILGRLKRAAGTDLDLMAVAFEGKNAKGLCWFDNTDTFDNGSLITLGDSRTGRGTGDDEFITANLARVPNFIDGIVFVVAAYKDGVSFDKIEGVAFNVYDMANGRTQIAEYMPDIDARGNAAVVAVVKRDDCGWTMKTINEMGTAHNRTQIIEIARTHV